MRGLLNFLWQEWKGLQLQIESLNTDLEQIASSDPTCVRLQQIPGVGPLVSTAVVSAIGNGAAFKKGREFAAWLGLIPRQGSTGGKTKLLGISKRGNPICEKCSSLARGLPSCESNATAQVWGSGSAD
jgi:transposase